MSSVYHLIFKADHLSSSDNDSQYVLLEINKDRTVPGAQ